MKLFLANLFIVKFHRRQQFHLKNRQLKIKLKYSSTFEYLYISSLLLTEPFLPSHLVLSIDQFTIYRVTTTKKYIRVNSSSHYYYIRNPEPLPPIILGLVQEMIWPSLYLKHVSFYINVLFLVSILCLKKVAWKEASEINQNILPLHY